MRENRALNSANWVKERDEALRTLDLAWARQQHPEGKDEVLLIGMHKARYEAVNIAPELRQQSRVWLEERGYKRIAGMEFPKDRSELPE